MPGVYPAPAPLRLRRDRALHRRQDDGDPPRQAPRHLRHQPEQRLEGPPRVAQGKPIEELLAGTSTTVPEAARTAVRNNGGGHANHSLFWTLLKPGGGPGEPGGTIAGRRSRPSWAASLAFKEAFTKAATTRFGSGWAWLVLGKDGKLAVTSLPNQDSPYMEGQHAAPRPRRLGTRLLLEVPEQAARIHRRVLEHHQLGRGQRALRVGQEGLILTDRPGSL